MPLQPRRGGLSGSGGGTRVAAPAHGTRSRAAFKNEVEMNESWPVGLDSRFWGLWEVRGGLRWKGINESVSR